MVDPHELAESIRDSIDRKAVTEGLATHFLKIANDRTGTAQYAVFSEAERGEIVSRATAYFLKHWKDVDPNRKPFAYLCRMVENAKIEQVRSYKRAEERFPSQLKALEEVLPDAALVMSHYLDDHRIKERYGSRAKANFMSYRDLCSVQKLKGKIEDESYLVVSAMLKECHMHRNLLKEILKSATLAESTRTKIEQAIR